MTIHIKPGGRVGDVQKQFAAYYPFLKVEFLKKSANGENKSKDIFALPNEVFEALHHVKANVTISAGKEKTVAELENDFKDLFGVNAQVFRKSGNVWIETTLTDKWTLEKQNEEGEQLSSHAVIRSAVIDFFGEQNQIGQETE